MIASHTARLTSELLNHFIFSVATTEIKVDEIMKNLSPKISKEVKYAYEYILEEGMEKGIEKGKRELLVQNVLSSYQNGLEIAFISKIMKVSEEEIIKIISEEKH